MADRAHRKPLPLMALSVTFILLWLIAAAFPFIWTAWGSFKVEADFFSRADWQNAIFGPVTTAQTGSSVTGDGYHGAWVLQEFWKSVINTTIVTVSVVCISLTLGTLGGYALARSGFRYTFWILIIALVAVAVAFLVPSFATILGGLIASLWVTVMGAVAGILGGLMGS